MFHTDIMCMDGQLYCFDTALFQNENCDYETSLTLKLLGDYVPSLWGEERRCLSKQCTLLTHQ